MTQSLNGQSYAFAIAKLLKEQEYAVNKIEKRTRNLHKIRHTLDNFFVDYESAKIIHSDYDRTYHQIVDEQERSIQKQEKKFALFLQRITEISQKTFAFLDYKSLSGSEIQKLQKVGYNCENLLLCEKAVKTCNKFLQTQKDLLQGRVSLFQTTLQTVYQVLKTARKKDAFSSSFWLYGLISKLSREHFFIPTDVKKLLRAPSPDVWMVQASKETATRDLFDISFSSKEVQFLPSLKILLAPKNIENADLYLDSFSVQDFKKSGSDESIDISSFFGDLMPESPLKDEGENLVVETINSQFIEESAWNYLNEAISEPIFHNDSLQLKFRFLKNVHGSSLAHVDEVKRRCFSILEDLKNRCSKLSTERYEDADYCHEMNRSEFNAKKMVGFDVYLQMKSLVEDLSLAQSEYQDVIKKISTMLVDKECIDHLKKLRFPTNSLRSIYAWHGLFQSVERQIAEQITLMGDLMLSLQKMLDTACLTEQIAEKKVYSFESSLHMFRREYVYFNLGLKEYNLAISCNNTAEDFV